MAISVTIGVVPLGGGLFAVLSTSVTPAPGALLNVKVFVGVGLPVMLPPGAIPAGLQFVTRKSEELAT